MPPISIDVPKIKALNEAWGVFYTTLRKLTASKSIEVPRDEASYRARKKIWDEMQKEMFEMFPDMKEVYEDQLVTLRARAEFRRLMYQHAALKQFERADGYDSAPPTKFIIDYNEDGEFAKRLWLNEYVPSMMDVIDDILRYKPSRRGRRALRREAGEKIVLKKLEDGPKTREELMTPIKEAGISVSELDNQILPSLKQKGLICKPTGYKLYQLKEL